MAYMVMCGTPSAHCTGGAVSSNAFLRPMAPKAHPTHSAAYTCYRRYLVEVLGYEDISGESARTFRPPPGVNNGYLRVLTKKSKFGSRIRAGKEGARWMPKMRGRSGVVIGT